LIPIPSQNQTSSHPHTLYLYKIYFNIIVPLVSSSLNCYPLRVYGWKFRISHLSHTATLPQQSLSPSFDHPKYILFTVRLSFTPNKKPGLNPEDESDMFFQNVGNNPQDNTTSLLRSCNQHPHRSRNLKSHR
jgi:hypothetical protein